VLERANINPSRFPSGVGILLSIAVALHIFAIANGLTGRPVNGSALFITGQFLISLALLRLYNGKWIIQDIRVFFAIFLFLYGGALPLVVLFGLAGTVPGIAASGYMYATAFAGFNLVQWWYKQPFHDIPAHVFARIRPNYVNVALLVIAFIVIVSYAYARGVSLSLSIDRGQRGYLNTQLWVVFIFGMNGLSMFMFAGWGNMTRLMKIAVAGTILAYVIFQLAMGNRRDFLPMLILIACVVANKRHMVIGLGTVIIGSTAFVFLTAIGIIRQIFQDSRLLLRFNAVELIVTQNEFVAPIYTLMHYVTNWRTPRWGLTYLAAPAQLIPRAIWPDKPESLSLQFMRDAFGSTALMGFAYTPVTEAFLNFSWLGPFVVFAAWSLVLVRIVKVSDIHPAFYLLAYALVVDFHRGDFAGTFYAIVFVGGAYAAMLAVSHLTWSTARNPSSRLVTPAPSLRSE
jgi:hypothetical protein